MDYDRKIKYFADMRQGERIRTCGFARLERKSGQFNLLIQLSKVSVSGAPTREVYALGGQGERTFERQIGRIAIDGGQGMLELTGSCEDVLGGIAYEDLQVIRIPVDESRELYCVVRKDAGSAVGLGEPGEGEVSTPERAAEAEAKWGEDVLKSDDDSGGDASQRSYRREESLICGTEPESPGHGMTQVSESAPQPLKEQKWSQLWNIYPHVNPFGDEREYLQIGPEDFVILSERAYGLVQNSFLLHGYHNYKHLLLGQVTFRKERRYYVGVPGNFYEREKQVAVMFGFESFECAAEPARTGDFGYYMIPVEL